MYFVGGVIGLEEEYHKALAENIVKELNQPKLRKESTLRGRAPSRDSAKSGKRVISILHLCINTSRFDLQNLLELIFISNYIYIEVLYFKF